MGDAVVPDAALPDAAVPDAAVPDAAVPDAAAQDSERGTQPRPGALDGIRVLDFSTVGPGARASRMLSDYGADVVKLAPVPADGDRLLVPPFYAYSGHRGCRRLCVDLKSPAGRQAFLDLAAGADVVIESFRPGVVDRLGVGYGCVSALNARIVYCSISGMGQTGPKAAWAGHDLNYLALGGYLHCSGRRADGAPALPGATVADIAAGGMHAVMAIMAALLRRSACGTGEYLDVSVADGVLAMMSLYADEYLTTGVEPGPGHYVLTGRYACYDTYACGDGGFLAVAAIEAVFWANLCAALGLDRYADAQFDDALQDEIRAAVAEALAGRSRDEWAKLLGPSDCCVAPVLSVAEAVADPQYTARGVIAEAEHETEGRFRQTGPVWAGTQPPDAPYPIRDASAGDAAELLSAVGYGADRIRELIEQGAVA